MKSAFFFLLLMVGFSSDAFSQKDKIAKADKKYDAFSYIDAISIYEKIAAKGYKSVDLFQRLGNAYYFNSEFTKAAKAYESLFELNQKVGSEYYYRYAHSLKSIGDYSKSDEFMQVFSRKAAADLRALAFVKNTDYLEKINRNSGRFDVMNAGINSKFSDYGGFFKDNRLVFTSARDTGGLFSRKMKWNNQAFTNLYSSTETEGKLSQPEKFSKALNSRVNESSAIFTKDGKVMYFTRNNFFDGKKGKSKNKVTLLKLYRATFNGTEWTDVNELPFNSNDYSVAHPALSPDESILYFASDMPGGFGQSDLYKVEIHANGKFGKPENLGKEINTEGKETFPFVSSENVIYFSSDGHPGLGGLDIFTSKLESNGTIGTIENVGEPVNSKNDDFAFIIDSENKKGFFSSDREGGEGSDDIYRFTETRKIACEQSLTGNVLEEETGKFLSNSKVILFNSGYEVIGELITDEFGYFSFPINCGSKYYLRASKLQFETKEADVVIPYEYGKTTKDILLEKREKPFRIGDDLALKFGITIYFDLGKYGIRPDAALELEKIFSLMQQYPDLKIDVRSHTDSRQSKEYNQKLSEDRAKSTVGWLVSKGISADRLTGHGCGESELLNHCADNVECTEQEHQLNRRSQFIVTDI